MLIIYREQRDAVRQSYGRGQSEFEAALNDISWSSNAVSSLQSTVNNRVLIDLCVPQDFSQVLAKLMLYNYS